MLELKRLLDELAALDADFNAPTPPLTEPTKEPIFNVGGDFRKSNCTSCQKSCWIKKVKKTGVNFNRPFISCWVCEASGGSGFEWLDQPLCEKCGKRTYAAQCKQGKNEGRTFRSCNTPKCSFKWIDEKL